MNYLHFILLNKQERFISKEAPVGFKQIRLRFDLDSNATEEQMGSLAKLTERYCVVYQTISGGVKIETSYN